MQLKGLEQTVTNILALRIVHDACFMPVPWTLPHRPKRTRLPRLQKATRLFVFRDHKTFVEWQHTPVIVRLYQTTSFEPNCPPLRCQDIPVRSSRLACCDPH